LVKDILPSTKFSMTKLSDLYDRFEAQTMGEEFLQREQFARLFTDTVPWWEFRSDLQSPLFDVFDKNKDGMLDFSEFASGLSALQYGSLEEKFEICFAVHDIKNEQKLDASGIYMLIDSISRLYFGEVDLDLNGFVKTVFVKAQAHTLSESAENSISHDLLRQVIIDTRLLFHFLNLHCLAPSTSSSETTTIN